MSRDDPDLALAATAQPAQAPVTAAPVTVASTITDTEAATPRALADSSMAGPRRLAHYQLEEEIGRGGMGVVYRARDLALDRPVAIKVLTDEFAGPAEHRARFYREARAQARVVHPNVCHIYYVGEEAGRLFFAMELVEGQSVGDLIREKGKLAAPRALEIVRQAALGLREAQRHGIVHRDVKPSNLMIDRHGVVKVMDFGIAKEGEPPPDEVGAVGRAIEQTTIAGTPLFAAPEQLLGDPIDHRADIYALGATLHQLLTGRAPFVADSVEKLTELHKSEERPAFERRVIGQRDLFLLNELTDTMMAKKADGRYDSYDALLEAIEFAEPSSSRPARFGVRALAFAIDAVFVVLLRELLGLVVPAINTGEMFVLLLALYTVVLLARFGKTAGRWLLGIEVTNAGGTTGIGIKAAAARCLWEFGPLVLAAFVAALGEQLMLEWLQTAGLIALGGVALLNVIHVATASFRSGAARTHWDCRAGTQVRYLRVQGVKASEAD